jgi:hypothetical protein
MRKKGAEIKNILETVSIGYFCFLQLEIFHPAEENKFQSTY